ncbi:MAG: single-stranded DNA-binding protein [Anaerolineales bacterium]|nr:single-stranded DNA-binding protein [Chloroflexota bacterium]MBL6981188.1 single-stranded DNA-binding protein [Anaerolineales bacterium]
MYQKIIIVGNLGGDPEMRYTPGGQAVTNFSVATSNKYTANDGQKVDETTWFRVSAWGRLAETCNQYLKRGRKVLVEGRLRPDIQSGGPRVYQRQDGTWAASFEITAQTVKFLSSRGEDDSFQAAQPPGQETEDDIPF